MFSIYYRAIKDEKLKKLEVPRLGSWINVIDPEEKEKQYLVQLGIDSQFIEDALDPDELPRIEKVKETLYVILSTPFEAEGKLFNIPFLVAITPDIFVTISKKPLVCIEALLKEKDLYTTQKTKNLLQICLKITQLYEKEIRNINKNIYTKKVNLAKLENKDIIALVEFEEILNKFITSLVSLIGVFEKILSGRYLEIFEKDQELTEDLIIDSRQSLDICKTSIKTIVNIREAYSAILSNELNKVMKFLTSLTIIIGVPTLIASIYGMNISLPLENSPLAFLYIIFGNLLITFGLVLIFYLKRWL